MYKERFAHVVRFVVGVKRLWVAIVTCAAGGTGAWFVFPEELALGGVLWGVTVLGLCAGSWLVAVLLFRLCLSARSRKWKVLRGVITGSSSLLVLAAIAITYVVMKGEFIVRCGESSALIGYDLKIRTLDGQPVDGNTDPAWIILRVDSPSDAWTRRSILIVRIVVASLSVAFVMAITFVIVFAAYIVRGMILRSPAPELPR